MCSRDPEKILKIVIALDLSVPPKELKSKDSRLVLSSIFSRWLPLAATSIQAVVEIVPSPVTAQGLRIPQMLLHDVESQGQNGLWEALKHDLYTCNRQPGAFVVVYVSKMFAARRSMLSHRKVENALDGSLSEVGFNESQESDEHVLGFARIYSGVLRVGMKLHAVLPKYDNSLPSSHRHNMENVAVVCIDALYTMMGRELVPIEEIRAGNVFAISGIGEVVWRNATLCGDPDFHDLPMSDPTNDLDTCCLINLGGATTGVSLS
jgi:ribosome assembly protein 1